MTETFRRNVVATSQLLQTLPSEDTLIDALRGCRHAEELEALEQRLRGVNEAPPLFEWIFQSTHRAAWGHFRGDSLPDWQCFGGSLATAKPSRSQELSAGLTLAMQLSQ